MAAVQADLSGASEVSSEIGECEVCGAPFVRSPRGGRRRRFCSERCKKATQCRQRGTLVLKRCESCGVVFEYQSTTKPRKHCTTCSPKHVDSPRRGRCRGCGEKVEGRAWYCAGCRAKHQRKRTRTKERPRGTMAQRGYGSEHSRLRKRWKEVIAREGATCARCGKPIVPGMLWDLGHVDGRKDVWSGPEHRSCNRATSRHRVQRRRRKRWSRVW